MSQGTALFKQRLKGFILKRCLNQKKKPPTPEQIAIGRRIAEAILSLGRGGQVHIAAKSFKINGEQGVMPQSVTGWIETGRISKKNLMVLEKETKYKAEWVLTGHGEKLVNPATAENNIEKCPDIRGEVPLISWVKAGEFSEAIDLHAPGYAEDWIETTVPIGPHTFALRVSGDSMEPDFPAGYIRMQKQRGHDPFSTL